MAIADTSVNNMGLKNQRHPPDFLLLESGLLEAGEKLVMVRKGALMERLNLVNSPLLHLNFPTCDSFYFASASVFLTLIRFNDYQPLPNFGLRRSPLVLTIRRHLQWALPGALTPATLVFAAEAPKAGEVNDFEIRCPSKQWYR